MIGKNLKMEQIRTLTNDFIQTYIQEKIIFAQQQMVKLGQELFSKRKHETIMVVGSSMIFDNLFKSMKDKGTLFTVIVVDTSPLF